MLQFLRREQAEFSSVFKNILVEAGPDQQAVVDVLMGTLRWFITAEYDDEVVGVGTVDIDPEGAWRLKGAYILPSHRGMGIGKALVLERLRLIREAGAGEVNVRIISSYSRRMYESLEKAGLIPDVVIHDVGDFIQ